ncbi:MAG: tetratricopeptide repeat protein [Cytophagales bacterium]|nr:tetratricopeptide repeat protein [Cytophagales bacterium]
MKKLILLLCLYAGALQAQSVDSLISAGIKLHDAGDYEAAIDTYKKALAMDSKSFLIYYEIGFSYSALNNHQEALKYAELSLSFATQQSRLHPLILKGSALDDLGRTAESVAFYKESLKEFPTHYLLLFNYAISLSRLGNYTEAEQILIQALSHNFNHPGSHLQLAKINLEKNHKSKAALGLYFFLMLENTSARAEENIPVLINLLYGNKKTSDDNKTIFLTVPDPKTDPEWASADLFFSILGIASGQIDQALRDKGAAQSEQQRFVADTEKFFKTLGELRDKRKKPKKKKAEQAFSIWWDNYVPFFSELVKQNHTEAFCYHIMAAANSTEVNEWLMNKEEKLSYFYLWANSNR